MADRTIRAILRAEVGQYKQAMAEAAKATQQVGSESTKTTTSLGRMVRSARDNREAWTTTGTAIAAVGAAITAVGVAALKTGIEYNTLQQTSRAALTTLLGSAEAANVQMDKLDDFARNSPFAKQVFITAQQQMLGFGVAAEDVIPALDSIQNAVAAMGGSNDQIAAISEILARIKSEGRLSGDALQRLGYYGIDAAALIGDEMGKTSAEIRDMAARPGGIPVDQIWDPLVDGMNAKFGGAAANVKETFVGAVDRVKAAWRDLSSALAAPLVDPDGGGALVDWLNSLATTMRGFEDAPTWVKATTVGFVGLIGVTALLGGGAMLLVPRLVALYDGLGNLGTAGIKAQGAMKGMASAMPTAARGAGWAAAILLVAAATGKLVDMLKGGDIQLGLNEIQRAIRNVADTGGDIGDLGGQFTNFGKVLGMSVNNADSLSDAFDQLLNPSITDHAANAFSWIPGVTTYMENLEDRTKGLDEALTAMISAGDVEAVEAFQEQLRDAGYSTEEINKLLPQTKDALIGAADAAERTGNSVSVLTEDVEAAAEAHEKWLEVIMTADAAFIDSAGAYDAVIAKNQELAQSTADATEDAEDSWTDYYDGVTVSADDFIAQLQAQVDAQTAWEDNILAITTRVKTGMTGDMADAANGMIDELMTLGPEGAAQIELLKNMSDEQFAEVVALWAQKGTSAVQEFTNKVESWRQPVIDVTVNFGDAYRRIMDMQAAIRSLSGQSQFRVATGPGGQGGSTFAEGGYTGDMPATSAAGVVHGREFVHDAPTTAKFRPLFEYIHATGSLPGYAGGGFVEPRYSMAPAPVVNVTAPSAMGGFPDTVRLDRASVEAVAAAIVAGAQVTAGAVVDGRERAGAGTRVTSGRTF